MSLLCNDPPRQRTQHLPHFTSLKNLLAESDILTFHVPLIDEGRDRTFHLLNEENFQTLKRKPILINSARGAIVDNEALLRSIRDQKLGGTVLDVWENEPDISNELLDAADLGTPHIAGYSLDGKLNGTIQILEAVCHFFGLPRKWEPADLIPPTPVPRMVIKPGHEDEETVLGKTIKHIYNICDDDSTLRRNPARFDRLRAEYPLRREFIHTELVLVEAKQTLRTKFQSIGFRVTNSSQS
jgi:erythronate-4-phosphate dehydrogenase